MSSDTMTVIQWLLISCCHTSSSEHRILSSQLSDVLTSLVLALLSGARQLACEVSDNTQGQKRHSTNSTALLVSFPIISLLFSFSSFMASGSQLTICLCIFYVLHSSTYFSLSLISFPFKTFSVSFSLSAGSNWLLACHFFSANLFLIIQYLLAASDNWNCCRVSNMYTWTNIWTTSCRDHSPRLISDWTNPTYSTRHH